METKSSKPFEGWDINLLRKYRNDLFFRTTCHIILLQAVLVCILIGVFWYSLHYLGQGVGTAFLQNVQLMLTGGTATESDFTSTLDLVINDQFYPTATIVVATTFCFGFITTYIALTPTRRSLERKKRFINNVAHEIRTPLAIVRTNTEVALFDETIPDHLREALNENVSELDRIGKIMDNLLTLSHVMREEQMEFSDMDLSESAERAVATLARKLERSEVNVVLHKGETSRVRGNAVALEQVAFNIIKNAVTHSARGESVHVTVEAGVPGYVQFVVQDNGTGISREDLRHIFEPFYRAQNAPKSEGSGLGLAIVNEIIRIHRGKIAIRSREGGGTTVAVSLPVSPAHLAGTSKGMGKKPGEEEKEVAVDYSNTLFR